MEQLLLLLVILESVIKMAINQYLKKHHQKVVKNSFKLLYPSREELLKKTKISLIIGEILIIISILTMIFNKTIGFGIAFAGLIQIFIAMMLRKQK